MNLNNYMEQLFEEDEIDESVGGFAIDSFPTKANKKPLSVVYPESVDLDNYDIDGKRILIDFDQVIHKYSVGWIDDIIYDEPIPGVKQIINRLRKMGYEVIIFTSRLSEIAQGKEGIIKQKKMIEDWLKKYDIEVDGITGEKIPASLYIDDRCYHFKGKWSEKVFDEIKDRLDEMNKGY